MPMIINPYRFGEAAVSYPLRANFNADNQTFTDEQVLDTEAEGVQDGEFLYHNDNGDGDYKIVSNQLELDVTSSSGNYETTLTDNNGQTKEFGLTGIVENELGWICGFADRNVPGNSGHLELTSYILSNTVRLFVAGTVLYTEPASVSTGYKTAFVVGGYNSSGIPYQSGDTKADFLYGGSVFIKGNTFTNWTLIYRTVKDLAATLYMGVQAKIDGDTCDAVRAFVYDSPPIIPNNIDTSVSTGDTFTHIADCVIETLVTTLPSSGNLDIEFRRQDDDNKWICRVTDAGALSLVEVVATSETTRMGPVASAVSNGDEVVIVSFDEDIYVYAAYDDSGDYNSASNFKTDTGGKVVFGSGAVAHVSDWARGTNGEYSDIDNY
ncbi:MAG: hypothetical protein GY820_38875 [Gammaproteobacteria bacterium]|nr:hypothetical protein [Gammaproteobacteria bacterium]